MRISKTKAFELIKNAGSRFFTVTFNKTDGETATRNVQFSSVTELGAVLAKKKGEFISFYPREVIGLKINKQVYTIRK